MGQWKEIEIQDFNAHSFTLFDKDWALLTAEAEGKVNTMTVSWGALGTLWGNPTATVYVRESRYTYGFMEAADRFTLSVLPESYRKTLSYLGSASGRDEDKIAKSGLTLIHEDGAPAFQEARLVLVCRKLYGQTMEPDCFVDQEVYRRSYVNQGGGIHKIYVGKVEKILETT